MNKLLRPLKKSKSDRRFATLEFKVGLRRIFPASEGLNQCCAKSAPKNLFQRPVLTVWTVATVAIVAASATDTARARTSFDGGWTVQIMTQRGACDPNSSFGVEIRDANVHGAGGVPVRGRVAGNGAVSVSVASGDQSANGSGRLSASSGGGTWHGVGSRGTCSGRWSASRR
jgi:hypothetical protein